MIYFWGTFAKKAGVPQFFFEICLISLSHKRIDSEKANAHTFSETVRKVLQDYDK